VSDIEDQTGVSEIAVRAQDIELTLSGGNIVQKDTSE